MDVSHASGLAYLVSCSRYHVPPAHVLVRFRSRFTCFSYLYKYGLMTRLRLLVYFMFLLLSCRLVCLRFSLMPVFFYLDDSSPCLSFLLMLTRYSLSTRLPARYLWTLTHL